MSRYTDTAQATADGFRFVHEPDQNRFAVYQNGEDGDTLVGEAHYSLLGDQAIDFDHTLVIPAMRGTGIANLLAQYALTNDIVRDRRVQASCWYISGYLTKHPEILQRA